ncbi:sensor domain-containing diguanylate cyclase [Syntrophomonas wolfei]|uniref:Diguanylate cyclase/phosphodiesterase (GGDEF & EAL domains) with PAS/PAC sensor(S) n=1 Tax=Syntrophomonas wolfei subsp. wolfei (strain DSM 2245B / Goettingen) TaxID=335541 RepID=Q0B027_SYNWW|nr:sensor domain-containing diguanylate cyclase [Syntrophomonas wolfei]ABI67677.1 diguanylate cyclase/phosphodiesterase (GGDEF & EAL domains) with PAS/PAC sensor(s) [Syntrophomonas wolfei subsp. wolfei str. Goettingen G311]
MFKLAYLALDKVNQGIIILDKDLKIVFWNAWLEQYTGKSQEETIGQKLPQLFPNLSRKPCLDAFQGALFHRQSRFLSGALHHCFIAPVEDIRKDVRQNLLVEPLDYDDEKYMLLQISDLTGHYSRVKQLKHMIKEIDSEYEQVRAAEKINRFKAFHDALTGLPNRYLFYDRLDNAISMAQRNKEMLAVVFLDLDGFKEVNDNYGHEAGDHLLQVVAERLRELLRESDTLARLGGDEFLFIFPQIKSEADAATIAKKILTALANPFMFWGREVYLTASIGISLYPKDAKNSRNLINKADLAMYQVKNSGKNDYHFYNSGI